MLNGLRWLALLVAVGALGCVEPLPMPPEPGTSRDAGEVGCSPISCTGCCRGDVCLGGNEGAACGYGGRACVLCALGTSCLVPGTCVSDPRDAGTFSSTSGRVDAGAGVAFDPLTGRPIDPPRQGCVFIFGRLICG